MRRPLIVTDVGDMGRLLREIPAGLVVQPDDPEALCEAMREMARSSASEFAPAVEQLAGRFDVDRAAGDWLAAIAG